MHTLLGLSSLLLILLAGYLTLGVLRRASHRLPRRDLQLLVLAAPVVSLGLGIAGLHHFAGRLCFVGAPPWDYTLGVLLPAGMGTVALGALALGLLRLVLMDRLVARRGRPADDELQALVDRLARRLGTRRPRLLVCAYDQPLALTCGLLRPVILVSTWMVEQFDRAELESVLAHELAHAARRDYLVVWLATVLRDAFCYLPTSWAAYRQLQREKEPVCDDLAVVATSRPLALASALAKVWHRAVSGPSLSTAPLLMAAGDSVEARIERLLGAPPATPEATRSGVVALAIAGSALVLLLAAQAANAALMLAPMGCGPASHLWSVLV